MILDDIVAYKRRQIEEEKKQVSINTFIKESEGRTFRNFKDALSNKNSISIIGEVKKASPSKGLIKNDFDPAKIAEVYESIGIDAVSVLTEKKFFLGADEYLTEVRGIVSKPILRKDFIIDEYQLYQARAIGADAVLLIASILKGKLKYFYDLARGLGLQCITEVHHREETEEALDSGCDIIGINNRNLKNFQVSLQTTEQLIRYMPKDIIKVSESGINTAEDIIYLHSIGADAVLIGECFMRYLNEGKSLSNFIKQAKGEADL